MPENRSLCIEGKRDLWLALDDALDDLPRFFAVVDQPKEGVDSLTVNDPHMVCCVAVGDVRTMLRQRLAGASGQNGERDD